MVPVLGTLGYPPTKAPVGFVTVVSYILPPLICYFIVAVLAITPQTHTIRIATWLVISLLALRAVLYVDTSLGMPKLNVFGTCLAPLMFVIVTRTFEWTLSKEPLARHLRPANSSPSAIMDALDLIFNLRGHGWNWSRGSYIPRETRPTRRPTFLVHTCLSAIAHALLFGVLHRAILTFTPVGSVATVPNGSTLFDPTLPLLTRYLRSSIITLCGGFMGYAMLQMGYAASTILAVLFLGQDPAQWPPLFDAPWRATSLSEFWSRRWHQLFRRSFLVLGGYPLAAVFGRPGMVVGTFLVSAVSHHVALLSLDDRIEIWWMLVGFGMMVPGVLAENAFRRMTGKRVGGVVGWVWTMVWLVLWGGAIIEGFARTGVYGYGTLIDRALLARTLVERLVVNFDGWLCTIQGG